MKSAARVLWIVRFKCPLSVHLLSRLEQLIVAWAINHCWHGVLDVVNTSLQPRSFKFTFWPRTLLWDGLEWRKFENMALFFFCSV